MAEGGLNSQTVNHLIERTGYSIRQVNGERIYGPHFNHRSTLPPKGCEVFFTNLPRDIFEDDLVPIFSTAGTIFKLRLLMEFNGFNRGYAFVTYLDHFGADRAIKLLDNYEIRPGHNISVHHSVNNCRLFVGGIPRELTRELICKEILKHTTGVDTINVYAEDKDRLKNRGCALISYQSYHAAAMAMREWISKEVRVHWSISEPVVDEVVMQRVLQEMRNYRQTILDCIVEVMEEIGHICILPVNLDIDNLSSIVTQIYDTVDVIRDIDATRLKPSSQELMFLPYLPLIFDIIKKSVYQGMQNLRILLNPATLAAIKERSRRQRERRQV